eukprot:m.70777 g.70777  ORF g.70777 m.70777 type:complete len:248 (-) comp10032_c0_seq1:1555-2298(-)
MAAAKGPKGSGAEGDIDDREVPEHIARVPWKGLLDDQGPDIKVACPDPKKFDQVYHVKGLLSEGECIRLIDAQEKEGFGYTNYRKAYRGNLRLINDDPGLAEALYPRILSTIPTEIVSENDPSTIWKPVGLNTRFRCSKYYPGDVFGAHVDASFAESRDVVSLFTVNIYTSTIAKGGETRFYFNGRKKGRDVAFGCKPVAGDAVIFRQPSGRDYLHDGASFPEGIKYLLRTDVMYRREEAQKTHNNL